MSTLPFVVEHDDKAVRVTPLVMRVLSDGRWHPASSLRLAIADLDDRTIRQIAERSDGEIVSGQFGYRLTAYATAAEARHAEHWLQSQGRKMLARAVEIRNARARSRG